MNGADLWEPLNAAGFHVMRYFLSVLWQSSILLMIVASIDWYLRKRPAWVRHALWTTAVVTTPLLPFFAAGLAEIGAPHARVAIMPPYVPQSPVISTYSTSANDVELNDVQFRSALPSTPSFPDAESVSVSPPTGDAAFPETPTPLTITTKVPATRASESYLSVAAYPWALAVLAYVLGAGLSLLLVAVGGWRIRRWVRKGGAICDPRVLETFDAARQHLELARSFRVVDSSGAAAPMTVRTIRPVVLLPSGLARRLPLADLHAIALHELAHVKRHDPLVLAAVSVVRAVLFFHPLIWWAARRIRDLAEHAADDAVLAATGQPVAYAKLLTRLAEQLPRRNIRTELAVGLVCSESAFLRRVQAILSERSESLRRLSRRAVAAILIAGIGSIALAAAFPLAPQAADQSSQVNHAEGEGASRENGDAKSDAVQGYPQRAVDTSQPSTREPVSEPNPTGGANAVRDGDILIRRIWSDAPDNSFQGSPSPDGKYLSFIDRVTGDVAVFEFATRKKRRVTNEGYSKGLGAHSAFSPEGTQIAYGWYSISEARWELRIIGIDGNGSRLLVPNVYPTIAGWTSDGRTIWAILEREDTTKQIASISVDDGSIRVLRSFDWKSGVGSASLSPDGRYIAYGIASDKDHSQNRDVHVISTDGSREVPLVVHPAHDIVLGWARDGERVVFASDRSGSMGIFTVAVGDGVPSRQPELVAVGMGRFTPLGLTPGGSFYYGLYSGSSAVFMTEVNLQTGQVLVPPVPVLRKYEGYNSDPILSPDGRYVACRSMWQGPLNFNLLVQSLETGEIRELPIRTQLHLSQWSPDGKSLMGVGYGREGRFGILRIDANTGELQTLAEYLQNTLAATPNGDAIYFTRAAEGLSQIVRRDLASGADSVVFQLPSPGQFRHLVLSRDGSQFAFVHLGTLKVLRIGENKPRDVLELDGEAEQGEPGRLPISALAWTPDGKQLLFSTDDEDGIPRLQRIAAEGGEPEPMDINMPELGFLSIHPDGRRIFFHATLQPAMSDVWVMENFLSPTGDSG